MGQRGRAVRRRSSFGADRPSGLEARGFARLEGFALALPHDFPHHGTVYKYFQKWERAGVWKEIHDSLRHQLREKMGRKEKSTVAIADSQSVETTEKSGATLLLRKQPRNAHQDRGRSTDMMVERKSKVENAI